MMRTVLRWGWLAAVAGSLAVGAWGTRAGLAARPRVPFEPRASSDSFLGAPGAERPGEALHRSLSRLPEDAALVFVGPADDPAFYQTFYTVSLLALPRQVGAVGCRPADGGAEIRVPVAPGQRVGAVVFFRSGLPGIADLALARIAPGNASPPWTSYCSSSAPRSS